MSRGIGLILADIFTQFRDAFSSDTVLHYSGLKNQIDIKQNNCLLGYKVRGLRRTSLGGRNFQLERQYSVVVTLWTPLNTPLNHAELIEKFQNFFLVTDFQGVNKPETNGYLVDQDPQRPMMLSQMEYSFSVIHDSNDISIVPDLKTLTKNFITPMQDLFLRDEVNRKLQSEKDEDLLREEDNA